MKHYKQKTTEDTEYLSWCQELKDWQEADDDMRSYARECDRFLLDRDGQWEESVTRQMKGRPRYTFDKITPMIETIMAEIEDMSFGCNVKPGNNEADQELADLYEGMIRTIETISGADSVYRGAVRRVLRRGFDAWKVKSKYLDDWSFEQDLCVEYIPNSISRVWLSPSCVKMDGSDTPAAYVLSTISLAAYKEQYPNGSCKSVDTPNWDSWEELNQPEVITIGERYYKKPTKVELVQLSNGQVMRMDEKFMLIQDELAQRGVTIQNRKTIEEFKWFYRQFDGGGFLGEEMETPFVDCPVITAYGNFEHMGENSKISYSGLTQKLIDAQRVHNYAKSRDIEESALAPRKKLMMTKAQAKGHESQLQRMNTSADPVQFYNPDELAPQPYETGGAQPNPQLNLLSQTTQQDIQAQASVSDSLQGQFAGRQSEDAIRMQIDRGTAATRKWINPVVEAIQQTGRVLIGAIPRVYDTKRVMNITNIDGTEAQVTLNEEIYDQQSGQLVKLNDLNKGRYRVSCSVGQKFSNQQEAALTAVLDYAKVDPTIVELAGDLLIKAIDAPLIGEIAERKRAQMLEAGMIPPEQMTDEEKQQMMERMQREQQNNVDPNQIMAMSAQAEAEARIMEGQAAMQNEINDANKILIDKQRADNDTARVQIQAAEAGVKINKSVAETNRIQQESAMQAREVLQPKIESGDSRG